MKDAGFALQTAYCSLLQGLAYEGKSVAVYSILAPDYAQKPYVLLGPWQGRSENSKYGFGQVGEITLDVVTEGYGNDLSRHPASDIANLITGLLLPTPTASVLDIVGFKQVVTTIESIQDLDTPTESGTLIRKLIQVTHHLAQI